MVVYCKNIDTGKYHKIEVLTWDHAEYSATPVERLPEGALNGGLFKIEHNTVIFLDPDKAKVIKRKSPNDKSAT